jgi:hypothetical protein
MRRWRWFDFRWIQFRRYTPSNGYG